MYLINKVLRRLLVERLKLFSHLRLLYFNGFPFVQIGVGAIIESNVTINTLYGGSIVIGNCCELRKGCQLLSYGGNIKIGDHSSINPYTMIYGQGNITIGSYVRIATHCVLIPSNHIFSDVSKPIYQQGLANKGIVVEDDVWIGCGVRIMDGVVVAKGCVIGAGSVVTTSTEPYGVYVGIPAKKIKSRI